MRNHDEQDATDHEAARGLAPTSMLLPCPFCGSGARLERIPSTRYGAAHWKVFCFACLTEMSRLAKSDVIAQWNTRVTAPESVPQPVPAPAPVVTPDSMDGAVRTLLELYGTETILRVISPGPTGPDPVSGAVRGLMGRHATRPTSHITTDPEIRGGNPVLKGTRFTVSQALAQLAQTSGPAEFSEEFDIDIKVVQGMLMDLSMAFQGFRADTVASKPSEPDPVREALEAIVTAANRSTLLVDWVYLMEDAEKALAR